MPIVTFHLVEGRYPPERLDELLERASTLYARVLDSPLERVRAFVAGYPAERVAVAGTRVSRGAQPAPYFEFLVLHGRPVAQRHALLAGFTDLLVELLDAPRALIRGRAVQLEPDDWAIAGEPASATRRAEIQARAGAGSA
ncbi:MAG TPA: tautomerase family protein [Pseudonocardia sp.]|jgi:phenylpyruvate tautomerase PptA (4-oxalocrotonate tautomerase family)|uniref:tautomerase family protein n=1 Tax=Pseudonocardia sp. TaxID=60912 RepID=UPI002BAE2BA0|nr:tautomerase family protein [Pseudonocardia sp.]HTF48723.1 tautomerase family protein [Pseudonocardia sp.]